ncbi:hypothetical protein Pta6605_25430 [Pseudomonas amygdali pv. tabaci]|nr:hypothetical protein Pta6605_25430 [Pseudomonas amygdali pv. tabaci]
MLRHRQTHAVCYALQPPPLAACPAPATPWFRATAVWTAKASHADLAPAKRKPLKGAAAPADCSKSWHRCWIRVRALMQARGLCARQYKRPMAPLY